MRALLVSLVFATGTALAFRSVVYAAALFFWADIFQPISFARMGGYPVAQYVFVILILSYITGLVRGKIVPRFTPFLFLTAGLMLWCLICTIHSDFHETAWDSYSTILKYLIPILIIHTSLQTNHEIKILIACLAGSVAIWSAQAGAHCLIHGVNIDLGIPGGQMGERNDFAAATVGTLPVLLYFVFSKNIPFKWIIKPAILLIAFLSLMMIFFSLSRGGAIGVASSVILYIIYVSKKRIRDLIILITSLASIAFFLPQSWFERMNTINLSSNQTEGSAKARMNLLVGAYHATLDYPIFGLGPGGWLEVSEAYTGDNHNPHNIYLVLSTETGIVGLVFYLVLIGFTYFQISKTIRLALKRKDFETARLASALIMSIFGLLSAMTFLNRPYNEYLWAWIAIANALPGIYQKEIDAKRKTERILKAKNKTESDGAILSQ